jgi:hypothetical protein
MPVTTSNDLRTSHCDEPMAQLHGGATQLCNDLIQHKARANDHKRDVEESSPSLGKIKASGTVPAINTPVLPP